ncbi:MAG: M23 family metallopeptidase [Spirochaetia bacterium]|nr:M23 family metallopeptidase [Spirochaetia bacterium]
MFKHRILIFIYITLIANCRTDVNRTKIDFTPNKKILTINKTKVLIPKNYKQNYTEFKEVANNYFNIELYARQFVHGDIIYAELVPKDNVKFGNNPKIKVNGAQLQLKKGDWGYRGFFTIHPENENRKVILEVKFNIEGKSITEYHAFELDEKMFPVSQRTLDIGKFSRTDLPINQELSQRIQNEYKLKESIFKLDTHDQFTGALSHPRNFHSLTSPFYEKRIYEQYEFQNGKKISHPPSISYHRGLDFYARLGDPVFSMASGTIVLAQSLYYEGNCVIIDHGSKIFSVYMHMSKLKVKEGQTVKPGDLIGYAGATGISTGAHLHVSLYVNSIPTDPLSLLFLPIRD